MTPLSFKLVRRDERLLAGIKALKNPDWDKMTNEERLLHACLCAYAKHCSGNEEIGWDELSDILHNAIANHVGDDRFVQWGKRMKYL